MNRKMILCLLACLLCLSLLLAGCGKKEDPAPAEEPGSAEGAATEVPAEQDGQETVIPDEPETPAAPETPAEPDPTAEPAPAEPETPAEPAPAEPAPVEPAPAEPAPAEPAPAEPETPAPVQDPSLPIIHKDPTDETVWVGGECSFVTRFENAIWAVWHFVSPDGQTDLTYEEAQERFPYMIIDNGDLPTMTLIYVPADLNGWRVYCRYSNRAGFTDSQTALITVIGG